MTPFDLSLSTFYKIGGINFCVVKNSNNFSMSGFIRNKIRITHQMLNPTLPAANFLRARQIKCGVLVSGVGYIILPVEERYSDKPLFVVTRPLLNHESLVPTHTCSSFVRNLTLLLRFFVKICCYVILCNRVVTKETHIILRFDLHF